MELEADGSRVVPLKEHQAAPQVRPHTPVAWSVCTLDRKKEGTCDAPRVPRELPVHRGRRRKYEKVHEYKNSNERQLYDKDLNLPKWNVTRKLRGKL